MPLVIGQLKPESLIDDFITISHHFDKSAYIRFGDGKVNLVFLCQGKNYLYSLFDSVDPMRGSLYTVSLFNDGFCNDHKPNRYLKKHDITHNEFLEWLADLTSPQQ